MERFLNPGVLLLRARPRRGASLRAGAAGRMDERAGARWSHLVIESFCGLRQINNSIALSRTQRLRGAEPGSSHTDAHTHARTPSLSQLLTDQKHSGRSGSYGPTRRGLPAGTFKAQKGGKRKRRAHCQPPPPSFPYSWGSAARDVDEVRGEDPSPAARASACE